MAISQITSNSIATGAVSAADLADGSISAVKLDTTGTANSSTYLRGDMAWSSLPSSGKVLQVVQTVKTDFFSTTSGSYVDITGLSASITPSSTSSKILVMTNFFCGSGNAPYPKFQLLRNSTNIFQGDARGSATQQSAAMYTAAQATTQITSTATTYLDSPATTSAVTYKWQVFTYAGRVIYVGATEASTDLNNSTVPSTITLMEIAG